MLLVQQSFYILLLLIISVMLAALLTLTALSDCHTLRPFILCVDSDAEQWRREGGRARLVLRGRYEGGAGRRYGQTHADNLSLLTEEDSSTLHNTTIESLFTTLLPDYLTSYKNPCWIERINSDVRLSCLPYFFLVGFPKCATTDVFYKLTAHPEIVSLRKKEIHFWNTDIWNGSSLGSYLRSLSANSEGIRQGCAKHTTNSSRCKLVMGDGTPGIVLTNRLLWKNYSRNRRLLEPRYISADLIRHYLPDAEIIVNLRDPVERLYSEYYHHAFHLTDPSGFHRAAKRGTDLFRACLEKNFIRTCVYDGGADLHLSGAYLRKGVYYVYLLDWLKRYSNDQIHVVMFEDYKKNQSSVLPGLTKFLELEDFTDEKLRGLAQEEIRNSRKSHWKEYGDMFPETRQLLQNFYRPYNRRLLKLISKPLDYWGY